MPELTRLMVSPLKCLVWSKWKLCSEGLLILTNLWVVNTNRMQLLECLLYFLSNAAICFAKIYLKVLPYRRQGFSNFNQCFYSRLKKHSRTTTLRHRLSPTRLSKSLPLSKNIVENNEVVGSNAQLLSENSIANKEDEVEKLKINHLL